MRIGRISKRYGELFHSPARAVTSLFLLTLFPWVCLTGKTNQKVRPLPWPERDWTTWTLDDINQVLNDSPWSRPTTHIDFPYCDAGMQSKQTLVQFRSALPVRQALLRQAQLDHHYEKMNPKKKLKFDQQHFTDLTAGTNDYFRVVIYNSSISPQSMGQSMDAPSYPCTEVYPDPPTRIYLRIQDGPPISPVKINKVKYASTVLWESINQYEYLFPRTIDGKPLFSPGDEPFRIQLGEPLFPGDKSKMPPRHDFKITITPDNSGLAKRLEQMIRDRGTGYSFNALDLVYKGKLEY